MAYARDTGEESDQEVAVPFWRELLSRWALTLLVLAVPVVYAPRVLFPAEHSGPGGPLGKTAPGAPPPAWMHLCVVTTGATLADLGGAAAGKELVHLRGWRARSSNARSVVPAAEASAGNAATLWTGRWAAHHGVLTNDRALPAGAWTLAESARRTGAATAAILDEPFVSATRIDGFETVVEDADLDVATLGVHTRAFLIDAPERRAVLWLHLRDPGPGGRTLDAALGAVQAAFEDTGRWSETLTLLVPLGAGVERVPPAVPAWVGLPAPGFAGRRNEAPLALADLTGILRDALRLPPPSPLRREADMHARAERAFQVLRGWEVGLDALLHGPERVLWVTPELVLEAPHGLLGASDDMRVLNAGGETADAASWWAPYREREADARRNATAAQRAQVPREWRGRAGW